MHTTEVPQNYLSVPVVCHEESTADRLPFNSGRESRIGIIPDEVLEIFSDGELSGSDDDHLEGHETILKEPVAHGTESAISDTINQDTETDQMRDNTSTSGGAERSDISLNICSDKIGIANVVKDGTAIETGNVAAQGSRITDGCQEVEHEGSLDTKQIIVQSGERRDVSDSKTNINIEFNCDETMGAISAQTGKTKQSEQGAQPHCSTGEGFISDRYKERQQEEEASEQNSVLERDDTTAVFDESNDKFGRDNDVTDTLITVLDKDEQGDDRSNDYSDERFDDVNDNSSVGGGSSLNKDNASVISSGQSSVCADDEYCDDTDYDTDETLSRNSTELNFSIDKLVNGDSDPEEINIGEVSLTVPILQQTGVGSPPPVYNDDFDTFSPDVLDSVGETVKCETASNVSILDGGYRDGHNSISPAIKIEPCDDRDLSNQQKDTEVSKHHTYKNNTENLNSQIDKTDDAQDIKSQDHIAESPQLEYQIDIERFEDRPGTGTSVSTNASTVARSTLKSENSTHSKSSISTSKTSSGSDENIVSQQRRQQKDRKTRQLKDSGQTCLSDSSSDLGSRTESSASNTTTYSYSSFTSDTSRNSRPASGRMSDRSDAVQRTYSSASIEHSSTTSMDTIEHVQKENEITKQHYSSPTTEQPTLFPKVQIRENEPKTNKLSLMKQNSFVSSKSSLRSQDKTITTSLTEIALLESQTPDKPKDTDLNAGSYTSDLDQSPIRLPETLRKRRKSDIPRIPRKPPHRYRPHTYQRPISNSVTPPAQHSNLGEHLTCVNQETASEESHRPSSGKDVVKADCNSDKPSKENQVPSTKSTVTEKSEDVVSVSNSIPSASKMSGSKNPLEEHLRERPNLETGPSMSNNNTTSRQHVDSTHYVEKRQKSTGSPAREKLLSSRESLSSGLSSASHRSGSSRRSTKRSKPNMIQDSPYRHRPSSHTSVVNWKMGQSDSDTVSDSNVSVKNTRRSNLQINKRMIKLNTEVERVEHPGICGSPIHGRREIVINRYDSKSLGNASVSSLESESNDQLGVSARELLKQMIRDEGMQRDQEGKIETQTDTDVCSNGLLKLSDDFGSGSLLVCDDGSKDARYPVDENNTDNKNGPEYNYKAGYMSDPHTNGRHSVVQAGGVFVADDKSGSCANYSATAVSDVKKAPGNKEHKRSSGGNSGGNIISENHSPIYLSEDNSPSAKADEKSNSAGSLNCEEPGTDERISRHSGSMDKQAPHVNSRKCHSVGAKLSTGEKEVLPCLTRESPLQSKQVAKNQQEKAQPKLAKSVETSGSPPTNNSELSTAQRQESKRNLLNNQTGSRTLVRHSDSKTRRHLGRKSSSKDFETTKQKQGSGDSSISQQENRTKTSSSKDALEGRLRRIDLSSINSILVDRNGNPSDLNTSRARLRDIRRQLKLSNDELAADRAALGQRFFTLDRTSSSPSTLYSNKDISSNVAMEILNDLISAVCQPEQRSSECAHRCHAKDMSGEDTMCCLLFVSGGVFEDTGITCDIVNPIDVLPVTSKFEVLLSHIVQVSFVHQERFTNEQEVAVAIPIETSFMTSWQEPVVRELGNDGKWRDVPGSCQIRKRNIDKKITPTVEVVIKNSRTLAVVARPRKDDVTLSDDMVRMTSSVDDRVVVQIPVSSETRFKKITLQVIPIDAKLVTGFNEQCRGEEGNHKLLGSSPLIMVAMEDDMEETFFFSVPCTSTNQLQECRLLPINYSLSPLTPGSAGAKSLLRPYTEELGRCTSASSQRPLSRVSQTSVAPCPTRLSLGSKSFTRSSYDDRTDTDRHLVQLTRGTGMRVKLLNRYDNGDNSDDYDEKEKDVLSFTIHNRSTNFVALETRKGIRYSDLETLADSFADYVAQRNVTVRVFQTLTDIHVIHVEINLAQPNDLSDEPPSYYRSSRRDVLLQDGDTLAIHMKGNIEMSDGQSKLLSFYGFSGAHEKFKVNVIDPFAQRSLPTFHGMVCLQVMASRRTVARQHWSVNTSDLENWETLMEVPVAIPKQKTQTHPTILKAPVALQLEEPLTEEYIHQLSLELVRDWDTLARALGICHARLQSIKQQNRNLISDKIVTDLLLCWLKRLPRSYDKVKPLINVLRKCRKWKLANELSAKYKEMSRNRSKTAKDRKLKSAIETACGSPVVCSRWRQLTVDLCHSSVLDPEKTIHDVVRGYPSDTTRCYAALYNWKDECSDPTVFQLVGSLRTCGCHVVADTIMAHWSVSK